MLLALVVTAAGSATYYHATTAPGEQMLQQRGGELEWLRDEFHLSPEQFAGIQKAHQEYAPACEQLCLRIARANANADRLIQSSKAVTPELAAALQEAAATEEEARRAMLDHIYAVAAQMPEAQASRYIRLMRHRVLEPALADRVAVYRGNPGTL